MSQMPSWTALACALSFPSGFLAKFKTKFDAHSSAFCSPLAAIIDANKDLL